MLRKIVCGKNCNKSSTELRKQLHVMDQKCTTGCRLSARFNIAYCPCARNHTAGCNDWACAFPLSKSVSWDSMVPRTLALWYQTLSGRVQGGSKCMLTPLITMRVSVWQQLYVTGIALGVAQLPGTWYLVPQRCWTKSCWWSRLSSACFKMRPKLSNLQYILTGTMVPRHRGVQVPLC